MPIKSIYRTTIIVWTAIVLASCGPEDMLWPSDRIGSMWVNRYGHSNSQMIWEFCDPTMTDTPGTKTTECTVPWVDELFIGLGIRAEDETLRDALWEARTWELFIDGYVVDLPAFNIADFNNEVDGIQYEHRLWRIRLRNIPEGQHILRYVMHGNQELENGPESQSRGTYELIVNFTIENR
jgi:hypothetical protein